MGVDYLLVHIKYTIPPALLLGLIFRPLATRLDLCKLAFILLVAIISTIPWDSYLLSHSIWSYPPSAVLGYTLWHIPVEELFFFVVQTWNTSLLYLLLSKPVLHVAYLAELSSGQTSPPPPSRRGQRAVGVAVAAALAWSVWKAYKWVVVMDEGGKGGRGMYMGLIWIWAGPFLLITWSLAHPHILSLPARTTLVPILVPTVYLWLIDTLALRKGTWVITADTKFNIQLWPHLELEEAVFFLVTNVMIVLGLVATDYAVALTHAFPSLYPAHDPTLLSAVKALVTPMQKFRLAAAATTTKGGGGEYANIPTAVAILRAKSKSFYLASGVFEGRLRLDLISLYAFCRAADDLIDDDDVPDPAASYAKLQTLLKIAYTSPSSSSPSVHPTANPALRRYITEAFPAWSHAALLSLPVHKLPVAPLKGLLDGFATDLRFSTAATATAAGTRDFPIATSKDLETYAQNVAGTVGQMFTTLVLHHYQQQQQQHEDAISTTTTTPQVLEQAAKTMGTALQYVNIARDIEKDARHGRVYIPSTWLHDAGLTPHDILASPELGVSGGGFRKRLLAMADALYVESRGAVEELPREARGGARVAVEGYMDIGRRLEGGERAGCGGGDGRAVRAWRAWKVLGGGV